MWILGTQDTFCLSSQMGSAHYPWVKLVNGKHTPQVPSLPHCYEDKFPAYRETFPGGGGGGVAQSCLTLCDPMDCSPPGSSIHGIFQARILEWAAISFSRGSSRPRDQTLVSRIVDRHFTVWATKEVPGYRETFLVIKKKKKKTFSKGLLLEDLERTFINILELLKGTSSWEWIKGKKIIGKICQLAQISWE